MKKTTKKTIKKTKKQTKKISKKIKKETRQKEIAKENMETKFKNILIDIDGTVSEDIPNEKAYRFANASVLEGAIKAVNQLYYSGNCRVTFFTARTEEHRPDTQKWLDKHGFKYHGLLMGKPRGGNYIWVDNLNVKGIKYDKKENNWEKILKYI